MEGEGAGEEAQQVQRVELVVEVGEGGNIWLEYRLVDLLWGYLFIIHVKSRLVLTCSFLSH